MLSKVNLVPSEKMRWERGWSKIPLIAHFIKNWGLSISTKEDEWGGCVFPINFFQLSNYPVFIAYIYKWEILTGPRILSMYFLVGRNTSKTIFSYANSEWKKLDPNIRTSSICNIFHNALLKFIRPVERKTFYINDLFGKK